MSTLGPDFVSRTIQLILAPAVMVTACAILVGGVLTRVNGINDRLRTMNRERLDLLRASNNFGELTAERIREIDTQTPDLLHRLRIEHYSLRAIYAAIIIFVFDMLTIALVALTNQAWAAIIALIVFLGGLVSLGMGVLSVALELPMALISITYEVERIREIPVPASPPSAPLGGTAAPIRDVSGTP